MFINREGKLVSPPINDIVECNKGLTAKFVVRLIKNEGYRKYVIAEEEFDNYPNENQLKWCLAKHNEASFAVVEEIFKLEDGLPFN